MRSETVKQMGLTEAIEGILVSLKDTGACRVNGHDLRVGGTVKLEIEAEAEEETGELEFEISWTSAQPAVCPHVSILIGSRSDLPVIEPAAQVVDGFGIANELGVLSAHRTPRELLAYVEEAEARGVEVFIAAVGGAAHLAGVVAANVMAPVIGVPVPSTSLQGLDSLLSIVQMPKGVPVAPWPSVAPKTPRGSLRRCFRSVSGSP